MDLDTEPPISAELFALLRCPLTRQPLVLAPPETIARLEAARAGGELRDRSGRLIGTVIAGGLLRADGLVFFPICEGIPLLTADLAITAAG